MINKLNQNMRGGGGSHTSKFKIKELWDKTTCKHLVNIDEEELTDIMCFICLKLQQACCLLTLENTLCKRETS